MKTYLKQATPEQREELADIVKSSVGYFYLIGGGHRHPGDKLCRRLVAAEPKLTLHELRPDIWDAPATPITRRATDPAPAPGHAGRQPPTTNGILDTVPDHAAVGIDARGIP
ncbi:hypothetical protein [Janthinobacterium sp. J1-1]|uniref:hypothetical protein n=1 Tax=Janthinobacterium sp. J1-1 TaxID=3065910 RepID=UPI002810D15D|nr:hypothetical protein [Janthinobacterium sp. J1-1]